jgi:hypothetical protein
MLDKPVVAQRTPCIVEVGPSETFMTNVVKEIRRQGDLEPEIRETLRSMS